MEYRFTLQDQRAAHDGDVDALIERLAGAGGDDALVGSGQPRRLALEFTREATHLGRFPAPVHEGSAATWRLADLLAWLRAKADYRLDRAVVDVARVARQVDGVRESRRLEQLPDQQLAALVG